MNIDNITKVARLYRVIREIEEGIDGDMTVRQLLFLLRIGSSTHPISQQELADQHDTYKSTTSRIIAALSGTAGTVKRDGKGLVSVDLDPDDMRGRLVSLSKEGEKLLERACKGL